MNWDTIESQWTILKDQFRQTFTNIGENELQHLAGKKDRVVSRVQQRYGIDRDEAERRVNEWALALDESAVPSQFQMPPGATPTSKERGAQR